MPPYLASFKNIRLFQTKQSTSPEIFLVPCTWRWYSVSSDTALPTHIGFPHSRHKLQGSTLFHTLHTGGFCNCCRDECNTDTTTLLILVLNYHFVATFEVSKLRRSSVEQALALPYVDLQINFTNTTEETPYYKRRKEELSVFCDPHHYLYHIFVDSL